MELHLKKNQAAVIMAPAVDSAAPETLKTGLTIVDTAYYKDGAGAWTALTIIASFVEIGTTGMYSISLTAAELNHDLIMIKMSATGMADSVVIIRTFAVDVDSLVRSTTPANALNIGATGVSESNLIQLGGTAQSATDLKDFADAGYDPVTNKVQGVVLVDTTAVNTDQRGTDGANTATPPTVIAIRQEMDTNSADLNAIATHLLDIKGTAFVKDTHSLPQCLTASGFSTFDVAVDVVTVGTNNDKTGYALTQVFPSNFADLAITLTTGKITVGTNGDKTGYSISGAKQTLDALNDIDGTAVTASNMRGTDSAMLATSAPANFGAMVITAGGAVDALVQGYLNALLTETTAGRIAGNVDTFFENGDVATTKIVDNVGAGGGGGTDWTTTELANIRYRLGINGTQTAPTSNVPVLPVRLDAQGKRDVKLQTTAVPFLENPDYEVWSGTYPAAFLNVGTPTITKETSIVKSGLNSVKVIDDGSGGGIQQTIHNRTGIAFWQGKTITLGVWVYATVASIADIAIWDGVNGPHSAKHSGGSTWEFLTVTITVDAAATQIRLDTLRVIGLNTAYSDSAILKIASSVLSTDTNEPFDVGAMIDKHSEDIKGTGFVKDTDSLKNILLDVTGIAGATMRGTDGANTTTPPTVIEIRQEMDTNSADLNSIITHLTDIKGATFAGATDSLEAIRNQGDTSWITATNVAASNMRGTDLALLAVSYNAPTLLEIEASTVLAKEAAVDSVLVIVALLKKYVRNFKEIIKIGGVNYLVIYDDGEISGGVEIIRKPLKDPSGLNITDIAVGALAIEEASSV